ncbi:hypothetical protein AK830_g8485 [Neonectria ditissima]|uniref:Terpene synthase n=1 Tax=Neonectria ditissima TaxID=78410 RepID=A0A0P7AU92_9HYPO|nr:hypothetical protein AK830_g8485 [Neonectria ditissima]
MKPARLDQDAIVAALEGRTLRVPDLTRFFHAWPAARAHPHHAAVVPLVDAAIDSLAAAHHHPALARRKRDDIAGLAALWFSQADDARLEALALYAVWLVCWDDVVDAGEGDLAADFEGAERWRRRTLDMVRGALRVDGPGVQEVVDADADAINAVFRDFAGRLGRTAPAEQRRRLCDEVGSYIASCGVEQRLRLERCVPDYDSYMAFRLDTVGGAMLCSLVEHATGEPLPGAVATAPPVRVLWTQVCVLLTIVNDLLSLKKELRTGCVINAVAALLAPERDLDAVVAELEQRLARAVGEFDAAAGELLARVEGDREQSGVVERYIDGCRAIVTGTLEFTLRSPRYNLAKLLRDDGSLEIVL